MADPKLFDLLGGLLSYPSADWRARVEACLEALRPENAEAAGYVTAFLGGTAGVPGTAMEELFTSTFDMNPACSLEAGWHLFGEDYARGAFLVKLRGEMRRLNVAESAELPDHLGHVLAVLGRMEEAEAAEFAAACVMPAIEKMIAGVAGHAENQGNAYEHALRAVAAVVARIAAQAQQGSGTGEKDGPRDTPADYVQLPVLEAKGAGIGHGEEAVHGACPFERANGTTGAGGANGFKGVRR